MSGAKAPVRVALIGCGAIGAALLEALQQDSAGLQLVAIVVRPARVEATRSLQQRFAPQARVLPAVPAEGVDLLLEAAGHSAIEDHVLPALRRGTACIVASVGALAAPGLAEALEAAATEGGTQVELIAGAIGAIDALAAARLGGLQMVRYTGRKPARAWQGTPAEYQHDLATLTEAAVIFDGTAREAARLFPKNANVAATVALAGLGLDATQVRLVADPTGGENVHEVEASGAFGRFSLSLCNQPLAANPKTSALTVYSALRALRNRAAALRI